MHAAAAAEAHAAALRDDDATATKHDDALDVAVKLEEAAKLWDKVIEHPVDPMVRKAPREDANTVVCAPGGGKGVTCTVAPGENAKAAKQ